MNIFAFKGRVYAKMKILGFIIHTEDILQLYTCEFSENVYGGEMSSMCIIKTETFVLAYTGGRPIKDEKINHLYKPPF